MANVFISYRRDDASGQAGRLAEDLTGRLGRGSVFMDVDSIAPGSNFEQRITEALGACQLTVVLIGSRWASAPGQDGGRRIDEPGDYVRLEVAAALGRSGVTVLPVLVERAAMPSPEDLPPDIAALTKLNALDLSNRSWAQDVRAIGDVALRHDAWSRRALRRLRTRRARVGVVAAVAVAAAAGILLAARGPATHEPDRFTAPVIPGHESRSFRDFLARNDGRKVFMDLRLANTQFLPAGDPRAAGPGARYGAIETQRRLIALTIPSPCRRKCNPADPTLSSQDLYVQILRSRDLAYTDTGGEHRIRGNFSELYGGSHTGTDGYQLKPVAP